MIWELISVISLFGTDILLAGLVENLWANNDKRSKGTVNFNRYKKEIKGCQNA